MFRTRLTSPLGNILLSGLLVIQTVFPASLGAAPLIISQTPLAKSSSASVYPNLMFILDNSGSMAWDHLPDYVDDSNTCKSGPTANASLTFTSASNAVVNNVRVIPGGSCTVTSANLISGATSSSSTPSTVASRIDSAETTGDGWSLSDSGASLTVTTNNYSPSELLGCQLQVTTSSGTLSPSTAEFTAAAVNKACDNGDPPYQSPDFNKIYYNPEYLYSPGVKADGTNYPAQTNLSSVLSNPYASTSTSNLATGYTETVWCNSSSPSSADKADATNISANCRVSTDDYSYPNSTYNFEHSRSGAPYYFRASVTGYCTDANLTDCIQTTTPSGSYTFPARVRFCKTVNDCQEKQNPVTGYVTPNYLMISSPSAPYGRIDVSSVVPGQQISTILVNGVNIIPGHSVLAGPSDTTATIATAIVSAINSALTTPEYRACVGTQTADNLCSGNPANRVTVFPQTSMGSTVAEQGTAANGHVLGTTGPAIGYTPAKWTLTFGTFRNPARLTSITIGGTPVLSGNFDAASGLDTAAKRQSYASAIAGGTALSSFSLAVDPSNSEQVIVTAPAGTGSSLNGASVAMIGSLSAVSNMTIGSSANSNVDLLVAVSGTTAINATTAAGGTNDVGEAAALATAMMGNAANSYTVVAPSPNVAGSNTLSIFTPIGTTSGVTPTVTQTPVPVAAGATASVDVSALTGTWRINPVRVVRGGACTLPSSGSGTAVTNSSGDQTNATNMATAMVSKDSSANIAFSQSGNTVTLTGTGAWLGAGLNGCTVSVFADERANGSITVSGQTATSDKTLSGLATFTLGSNAPAAVVSGAGNPSAFSGGYVSSGSPNFIGASQTTQGTSTGPIAVVTVNLGNGASSVKTFQRCDIKTDQVCVDGSGNFVGNNGTVTGGKFPRSSSRSDCANGPVGANPGYCTYTEEKNNFANWYAYYRTRMLSMKTSAGTAFSGIDTNYRVGFVTIGNYDSSDGSSSFLLVNDFKDAHRTNWFSTLYSQGTPNATPLRHALSSVGRYFSGKNPYTFTAVDPVQYACQQNFALLTTDGYWNEPWDSDIKQRDGTTMNNADGATSVARPYYDGGLGGICGVGDGTNESSSSSCGTLADVAYHYYANDIRPTGVGEDCTGDAVSGTSHDVCENRVKGAGEDNVAWQHMTTYTLGLGVDGTLEFKDTYMTDAAGDFAEIKAGTKNWPQVKNLHPTAVDDLWHAAVSGRGQYFSARNPISLTKSLRDSLDGIKKQLGTGAAAATSNLEPTEGDNFSYVASYTSVDWVGNLEARLINVSTGATDRQSQWCVEDVTGSGGTSDCSGKLKSTVTTSSDARNIYMLKGGALVPFKYDQMTTGQQAYFNPTTLIQYAALPFATKAFATGTTLVDYLRGQTGYEDQDGNAYRIYRDRKASFGDPVGSQPVYVKKSLFNYVDPGYAGFKSSIANREGTVFIGTNDGMLHAFNAGTISGGVVSADGGVERWAYVPGPAMPNMTQLADANYKDNHKFFVDGSPVVGDVCVDHCSDAETAVWKTILVGGYGGGGKGYFALDVTSPETPAPLWETSDADIGYSYGNPIITKRKNNDGTFTWVVLVTSGYNNESGTGRGYLYVLDAATGSVLQKLDTTEGNTASPSGLGKIEAYIADPTVSNVATHIYGGDLLGNVWRFTIDEGAESVVKIAIVKDASGSPQEIATRPIVTELADTEKTRYIIVATGKLVEKSDMTDNQVNSLYGFVDKYDTTGITIGTCSGCSNGARDQLTVESLVDGPDDPTTGKPTRISGSPSVEPSPIDRKVAGCMVDFPLTRERVNVDMKLTRGVVSAITNIPADDACTAGGSSWINFLDYKTCKAVNSYKIGDAIAVGMVVLKLPTGFVVTATLSDDPTPVLVGNVPPEPGSVTTTYQGRRVGWRLLFD